VVERRRESLLTAGRRLADGGPESRVEQARPAVAAGPGRRAPPVRVHADGLARRLVDDGAAGVAPRRVHLVPHRRPRRAGVRPRVRLLRLVVLPRVHAVAGDPDRRRREVLADEEDLSLGLGGLEARLRVVEDAEDAPVVADPPVDEDAAGLVDGVLVLGAGVLEPPARRRQRHVELEDAGPGDEAVTRAHDLVRPGEARVLVDDPAGAADTEEAAGPGVVGVLAVVGRAALALRRPDLPDDHLLHPDVH